MEDNKVDFFKLKEITFFEPETSVFKGLPLAYRAIKEGGVMPTVFNAANELAVKDFLNRKISFTDIYEYIEAAMAEVKNIENPGVDEILAAEQASYDAIKRIFI